MKKEIDIALDAQKKLLLSLLEKPKDFDKLPKRSVLFPKEKLIIPYKETRTVGDFLVLPKSYSLERFKRTSLVRK